MNLVNQIYVTRQALKSYSKIFKGIYTRVKNYVPWIKKHAADGICKRYFLKNEILFNDLLNLFKDPR